MLKTNSHYLYVLCDENLIANNLFFNHFLYYVLKKREGEFLFDYVLVGYVKIR